MTKNLATEIAGTLMKLLELSKRIDPETSDEKVLKEQLHRFCPAAFLLATRVKNRPTLVDDECQ